MFFFIHNPLIFLLLFFLPSVKPIWTSSALVFLVLVLRVSHVHGSRIKVSLSCGEAYQDKPVFWKRNGVELTPALQGNRVTVLVREMNGGNYTCHLSPDGEYLNHTVILVQPDNRTVILEEISPEGGHIHCLAPNYNGSFHCSWTRTQHRSHAAVLLVKTNRYMDKIPCELEADGSGVICQDASCPYKEERHRITLTVYIHSYSRLEAYTRSFYLREIVKPEKLPNLRVSSGQVFSWDAPDSWDKPGSYFGLHFQIKVARIGHSCSSDKPILTNITEVRKYEVNITSRRYVFCVRAQDKHTLGPWSNWSQCTVNKSDVVC
uniref:Interleukin-12 subunit beta n=2 Tax=Nothobranchius furzeri TaxID=105023 RepID=A0A8C6NQJ5_NOTFU